MDALVAVTGLAVLALAVLGDRALRRRYGTPIERLGHVVYAGDDPSYRLLRNEGIGLRGRPDFVVKRGPHGGIWWSAYRPVEYKTAPRPPAPRARDVAQLAAYGLLLQAEFGAYPRTGYLVYADGKPMKVRLGPAAEREVRRIVSTLRSPARYPAKLPLDSRCHGCIVRTRCPLLAAA